MIEEKSNKDRVYTIKDWIEQNGYFAKVGLPSWYRTVGSYYEWDEANIHNDICYQRIGKIQISEYDKIVKYNKDWFDEKVSIQLDGIKEMLEGQLVGHLRPKEFIRDKIKTYNDYFIPSKVKHRFIYYVESYDTHKNHYSIEVTACFDLKKEYKKLILENGLKNIGIISKESWKKEEVCYSVLAVAYTKLIDWLKEKLEGDNSKQAEETLEIENTEENYKLLHLNTNLRDRLAEKLKEKLIDESTTKDQIANAIDALNGREVYNSSIIKWEKSIRLLTYFIDQLIIEGFIEPPKEVWSTADKIFNKKKLTKVNSKVKKLLKEGHTLSDKQHVDRIIKDLTKQL